MKLLLDTNVLIHALSDSGNLSSQVKKKIKQASMLYVSAASIWEISIKTALGKLDVNIDRLLAHLKQMRVQPLQVSWEHVRYVHTLPPIHRDPFDRLLVAQAVLEAMQLLTTDSLLSQYSEFVIAI